MKKFPGIFYQFVKRNISSKQYFFLIFSDISSTQFPNRTTLDYIKISDDKRYELINGELIMTPSPVPKHQRVSKKIEFILEKFVSGNNLGEVFYVPCDVYLDNENVVQPDILFISKDRLDIIGKKNIQGAPNLTIEIISENSVYKDMVQKKRLYAKFNVIEYWIVITEEEEIEVYILEGNAYQLYHNI